MDKTTREILNLYNPGKFSERELAGRVGKEVGEDIVGAGAGGRIVDPTKGTPIPFQSKNSILTSALQFIPKKSLENFIKTGNIVNSTFIINTAKLLRITTRTLMQELANLSQNKTTR